MLIFILVTIGVVILDQLSKYIVNIYLPVPGDTFPIIEDIFHFTRVNNSGAAFGMLSEHRWIFMVLSVIAIIGIIIWIKIAKPKSRWIICSAAFIAGGGIGNMIDRVRLGYVVDFIDCRFINFWVFNIADSFVTVGCILVILLLIISEVKEYKRKKLSAPEKDDKIEESSGNEDSGTGEV